MQICVGVLALTSACRDRGIDCGVVDLSSFHHLGQSDFNEVFDAIMDKICATQPDLVGFSTMTNNLPAALELCERLKHRLPNVITVLGGCGASFAAEEIVENFGDVDFILRGESDKAFPDLVNALEKSGGQDQTGPTVKGAVFRKNGKVIDHGWPDPVLDMDSLPIPSYELWSDTAVDENVSSEFRVHVMEVGRGCPFKCVFCATSRFFKQTFRLKSVDRIIDEVLYIREKVGGKTLMFLHDLLTLDHAFIHQLCDQLIERTPGLEWKCYARLDTLNESILKKMRDAGCEEIYIGIEVVSDRMQEQIGKYKKINRYEEMMKQLQCMGFIVRLSFVVGFPFETLHDTIPLFDYVFRMRALFRENVRIVFGTLSPEKITPLYDTWKHTLSYDEYGGFPGVDFPVSWGKLTRMVREKPGIFYLSYHYGEPGSLRDKALRYTLLGLAVDKGLRESLLLAYTVLGDSLSTELVENIGGIDLPPMDSFRSGDYSRVMRSIYRMVLGILEEKDRVAAQRFSAVARYELAIMELSREGGGKIMTAIETHYDPVQLIVSLQKPGGTVTAGNNKKDGELRYYSLIKDEESGRIQFKAIPKAFADMIGVQDLL